MRKDNSYHEAENETLEIALVKIARILYEYIDAQSDVSQIARIDRLLGEFQALADDYHNETGLLHPDLGLELHEWTRFKETFLTVPQEQQAKNEKSGKGSFGITADLVADFARHTSGIIEDLEQELSLK